MSAKHIAVALIGLFVGLAAVQPSDARVVRLVVEQRTSFVGVPHHSRLHQKFRRGRFWLQQPHLQRQSTCSKQRICPNHRRTQGAAAQNPRQSTPTRPQVPLVHTNTVLQLQPRPTRLRREELYSRHDQRLCRSKRRCVSLPKLL